MKKILIIAMLTMLGLGSIASADFVVEWPNHQDFLHVVEWRPWLKESLYNTETRMYRWPKTLLQFNLRYSDFIK